jgi:two-component system sensor histidine kinase GlrK
MAVLFMALSVSTYAIHQLIQFNSVTNSVLRVDNRILDIHKKLADALLSQIAYEKKFIITKDQSLHENFLRASDDFNKHFSTMLSLVDSPQDRALMDSIKRQLEQYQSIFDEEVSYLKTNTDYPQDEYREEKERVLNEITVGVRQIKANTKQNTYQRIVKIAEAGNKSRKVVAMITAISLILGMTLSILITRSITRPLSVVKKQTDKIAKGDFESSLELSSPPEIKELVDAFNSMSMKLKEVDKMKSDFFELMSHELRTPITSIKEGTNLLSEGLGGEIPEKQKRLLSIISEESSRVITLVNSLLDLSKIEAGMMAYNFTLADLAVLIQKSAVEIAPIAEARNIRIDNNVKKLPPVKLDVEKILQVLRNLMANAVKFTPDGGLVTISAHLHQNMIEVAIGDTGPGIEDEDLMAIFDKFQQASLTNSNKLKGTGMGLAIVKHIINAHGGRVWAESEAGQGSTFIFVLPV